MYFSAVNNLQVLFPDMPVAELESIHKNSLDFDHALEIVLHKCGENVHENQREAENTNHSEAESVIESEADSTIQNINYVDIDSLSGGGITKLYSLQ